MGVQDYHRSNVQGLKHNKQVASSDFETMYVLYLKNGNNRRRNDRSHRDWRHNDQLWNRSPLWSFFFLFFADHRATVFTLSKTFETAQKKSCAAFLPIFVMKSGERAIKHIYFVSLDIYLHSSILTYLLIFISS